MQLIIHLLVYSDFRCLDVVGVPSGIKLMGLLVTYRIGRLPIPPKYARKQTTLEHRMWDQFPGITGEEAVAIHFTK